jgi:hypothetical protein
LIAGGVVFGFLLLTGAFSSNGAAATTTGGLDPATAQLYAQSEAIQAQSQQNAAAIAGQQNLADTQASYGLSLAQIQANAQTTSTNTAASVALAQINADAQTSQQSVAAQLQAEQDQIGLGAVQINDQLSGLEDTNATTVDIASLTAGEQEDIAGILGNTQVALSNNATQASIANTNAAVSIAKGQQSVEGAQGIESSIGGLATTGLLAAAFL